jgi:DNA-binding transcriptional LysR family regulator
MAIELQHLAWFRAIAAHGSLSAAARRLAVSQPTLTATVKTLEERLDTTLLRRGPRGVTLTESGQVLERAAEDVLHRLERLEAEIRGLETEDVGRFVIGCHESLGAYFLPELLGRLLEEAPRIDLRLWNAASAEVREAVVDGRVQFGLVVNPAPHPDLVMLDLFGDAVAAVVSSAEPATPGLEAARARLARGPLIVAGRVAQTGALIDALGADGVLPERVIDCGDLELVKSLALGGVGVALLPRRVAGYGHAGALRLLHPELPEVPDRIQLLFRGDLHRTRAALRVKDAILARGRSLEAQAG